MPAAGLFRSSDGSSEQKQAVFAWDGKTIMWVRSQAQMDVGYWFGYYMPHADTQQPMTNFNAQALQMMIDSSWAGGPVPPGFKPPPLPDSGSS